jgi:hypothetical protein
MRRADSGGIEVLLSSIYLKHTLGRYLQQVPSWRGLWVLYHVQYRRRYGRRQREGTPGAMSSTKVSTQAKNKNVRSDRFALMGAGRFQRGPDETAPHVAAGEREKKGRGRARNLGVWERGPDDATALGYCTGQMRPQQQ